MIIINLKTIVLKIRRIGDCHNDFGEKKRNLISALNNEKRKNSELENKRQTVNNE